jgi:hypothetical protein
MNTYVNTVIEQIKSNETFQEDMKCKMGFVPNELEGLGELATYIENENHIQIINEALSENGITNTNGLLGVIYGSLGSSSSQIVVPTNITHEQLVEKCYELFMKYHPDMDLLINDIECMIECVSISIEGNEWTVVLIPKNTLFDKYTPFYVLMGLYTITTLPITISNCIAHIFYKKNRTYLDIYHDETNFYTKKSASLMELFTNQSCIDIVKADIKSPAPFVDKYRENVFQCHIINGETLDMFQNTFVIPRTKTEGSFIDNGWDRTIWYKSLMGSLSIQGFLPIVDIGGGRTNEGYETFNIPLIMKNILKEMKSSYTQHDCFPICTGKIRTDIETIMCSSRDDISIVKLEPFHITPPYVKYFTHSRYRVPNTEDQVYLFVI